MRVDLEGANVEELVASEVIETSCRGRRAYRSARTGLQFAACKKIADRLQYPKRRMLMPQEGTLHEQYGSLKLPSLL